MLQELWRMYGSKMQHCSVYHPQRKLCCWTHWPEMLRLCREQRKVIMITMLLVANMWHLSIATCEYVFHLPCLCALSTDGQKLNDKQLPCSTDCYVVRLCFFQAMHLNSFPTEWCISHRTCYAFLHYLLKITVLTKVYIIAFNTQ